MSEVPLYRRAFCIGFGIWGGGVGVGGWGGGGFEAARLEAALSLSLSLTLSLLLSIHPALYLSISLSINLSLFLDPSLSLLEAALPTMRPSLAVFWLWGWCVDLVLAFSYTGVPLS